MSLFKMSQFLSSSRTDLDSPGSVVNDVYYDTKQIIVQDSEVNTHIGRYNQSLTSLQLGSTSQVVIPNQDIVFETYLYFKLAPTVANQTLPRGWAYDAIREVSFTFGQSNVSNLRLTGKSIRHLSMESCETKEKRSELLTLGGESFNGSSGAVSPEATIILPLPWSNTQGMGKKKGFDTSILNNPITIQITLNDGNKFYGGSAAIPTSMTQASIFLRQSEFANRANSLKMDLQRNPSLMYQYPLYHKYSPSVKNNIVMDGVTTNTVELLEFIESDLQTIVFSVHNTALQTATGANAPVPGACAELLDVELIYNGQTIYNAPGNSSRLVNMTHSAGASGLDNVALNQTTPWAANAIIDYIYCIPFGTMKGINFEYKYDNTGRYSSQTMQLRFKARQIVGAAGVGELHSTYVYSGVAAVQSGVVTLQFA